MFVWVLFVSCLLMFGRGCVCLLFVCFLPFDVWEGLCLFPVVTVDGKGQRGNRA